MVEMSGFDTIYIDEIDPHNEDKTYIICSPEVRLEWPEASAKIIFWLIEWYDDYWQRDGIAETWVSNRTYAEMLGAKFVPMGSHPGLGTTDKLEEEYDFIHISYDGIHRRNMVFSQCLARGLVIAPNGWGKVRDRNMRSSKALVNISQQAKYPAIAPLRASLAAAYGLPLIAEGGWDTVPYTPEAIILDYDEFPEKLSRLLQLDLEPRGEALHHKLCDELRFDKVVLANV